MPLAIAGYVGTLETRSIQKYTFSSFLHSFPSKKKNGGDARSRLTTAYARTSALGLSLAYNSNHKLRIRLQSVSLPTHLFRARLTPAYTLAYNAPPRAGTSQVQRGNIFTLRMEVVKEVKERADGGIA